MRLITCAACHAEFHTTRSDAEAAASFEAEHHVDHASVPTVTVCQNCAEAIRQWWHDNSPPRLANWVGGTLH